MHPCHEQAQEHRLSLLCCAEAAETDVVTGTQATANGTQANAMDQPVSHPHGLAIFTSSAMKIRSRTLQSIPAAISGMAARGILWGGFACCMQVRVPGSQRKRRAAADQDNSSSGEDDEDEQGVSPALVSKTQKSFVSLPDCI